MSFNSYLDPRAAVKLDNLHLEIRASFQGKEVALIQEFQHFPKLGSLSSFGSALQRIAYEMLERAIKELQTTP